MKYFLVLFSLFSMLGCEQGSEPSEAISTTNDAIGKAAVTSKAPTGQIFEYGIYNAQRKGRVLGSLTTNTGKVVTKPVLQLSETTNRVPLVKDTYFAYRYRLLDLPKEEVKKPTVELRKVLIHPTMTLPDGTTSNGWDRMFKGRSSAGQVIAFDGYVFNENYELVAGDWTFQIWFKEQKLVEQTFTTYAPDESAADIKEDSNTAENTL